MTDGERRYLRLGVSLILAQIVVALGVLWPTHKRDLLPFSRYDLFSKIARIKTCPFIYIYQVDDKIFDPPVSMYDYFTPGPEDFLRARDHLISAQYQYWKTGSLEGESLRNAERLWFKGAQHAKFEIRFTDVDQLEFLKNHKVVAEKSMGMFNYESRP